MLLMLAVALPVYAQIDELDELTEDVQCVPDSFITVYDQYTEEDITATKVAIWYSLAQEEYKYKKYKRALPYFWKVLVNDTTGKFKVVYSKIADSYFRLNEPDSTLLVAYRGLEKYPDQKTLHYWAGLVQDKLGRVLCAIPHYEKLTEIEPTNKDYWAKLAILYFNSEDERAIEAQQKVSELDPSDVEASRLVAQFTVHFGGDPLQVLKETWMKDTTNVENGYRYGKEAFDAGHYKDAIRPFKSILVRDSRNTSAMEYIGRSYEAMNNKNMAISIYKDILKIQPKNLNVMCLIASIYSSQNQFTTARSYVNQARRIDPGDGMPYLVMAGVYENAVTYCQSSRAKRELTYDDKLVYKKAVDEYNKAERDPNYKADANRRASQLSNANLLPSKEDYFMHNNRMEPKEECYSWMK
jgi:tetratricopeptide (TPR) repeat protein